MKYYSLSTTIKKIKRKFQSKLYKANIVSVGMHFLEKSFKSG